MSPSDGSAAVQTMAARLTACNAYVPLLLLLLVVVLRCSAIAVSAALLEEELQQQDNSKTSSSSSSGEPGTDVLITHGDRDEVVSRKQVER
jgi:predicted esterase